jgi:Domain of unknown function (DUF5668)
MHAMTINNHETKIPVGKLAWGLVLLAIGTLTFLETVDLFDSRPLWNWWPLLLIFLGAAGEIDALRHRRSDGSYITLGVGLWMLAGSQELFGLTYGTGFPVAVVVAGLGIVVHAIVDKPASSQKETGNDQQQ